MSQNGWPRVTSFLLWRFLTSGNVFSSSSLMMRVLAGWGMMDSQSASYRQFCLFCRRFSGLLFLRSAVGVLQEGSGAAFYRYQTGFIWLELVPAEQPWHFESLILCGCGLASRNDVQTYILFFWECMQAYSELGAGLLCRGGKIDLHMSQVALWTQTAFGWIIAKVCCIKRWSLSAFS